jgi:hypothetical protein
VSFKLVTGDQFMDWLAMTDASLTFVGAPVDTRDQSWDTSNHDGHLLHEMDQQYLWWNLPGVQWQRAVH